jgi:hypothetical protein
MLPQGTCRVNPAILIMASHAQRGFEVDPAGLVPVVKEVERGCRRGRSRSTLASTGMNPVGGGRGACLCVSARRQGTRPSRYARRSETGEPLVGRDEDQDEDGGEGRRSGRRSGRRGWGTTKIRTKIRTKMVGRDEDRDEDQDEDGGEGRRSGRRGWGTTKIRTKIGTRMMGRAMWLFGYLCLDLRLDLRLDRRRS